MLLLLLCFDRSQLRPQQRYWYSTLMWIWIQYRSSHLLCCVVPQIILKIVGAISDWTKKKIKNLHEKKKWRTRQPTYAGTKIHSSPNENNKKKNRANEWTHERNVTELLLANDVLICVWNCIELGILGYNLTISRSYLSCFGMFLCVCERQREREILHCFTFVCLFILFNIFVFHFAIICRLRFAIVASNAIIYNTEANAWHRCNRHEPF